MEKKIKMNLVNFPEKKETYESPVVEIAEVRVERGFAQSGSRSLDDAPTDDPSF